MQNKNKMDIIIDEETIEKTTNCDKNFNCLSNELHVYCPVKRCVDGKVHFIKCLEGNSCTYMLRFGDSYMCTCPVRKEIFKRYKI